VFLTNVFDASGHALERASCRALARRGAAVVPRVGCLANVVSASLGSVAGA
jgi:hypothetical protein